MTTPNSKPTPAAANAKPAPAQASSAGATGNPLLPPEESIWRKYSSHHEFPISTLTSVVVHFLVVLIVALGGAFLFQFGDDTVPELEPVVFAGGGGDGDGAGDPNAPPGPQEAVSFNPQATATDTNVTYDPKTITEATTAETPRLLEQAREAENIAKGISEAAKRAGDKGRGGPGTGGGYFTGHQIGNYSGSNAGTQTKRARRMDRWEIIFGNVSGPQYADKLANLGAVLAIPEGNKFRLFEDLTKRPVSGALKTQEDLTKLNRIYWQDSNPQSVRTLCEALGLPTNTPYVFAFLPYELEKEMLAKELAFKNLTEEQIEARKLETRFEAEKRDGKFVVKVIEQRPRRR